MELSPHLIPFPLALAGHVLYWPLLIYAALRAPWSRMRENEASHVLLGSCVAVLMLWQIKAGLPGGPVMHLLGATVLTLMFGWEFAILGLSVVLLGSELNAGIHWATLPVNGLLSVVLPVVISARFSDFVKARLPNHFFVYIYVAAFFGGALTIVAVALASTCVILAAQPADLGQTLLQHLGSCVLLVFPEAFLTGMMMTLLVAYRPGWVVSFDDERYLRR